MEIYLVGGAVRDKLLGYPVYDRDWVVVGATPPQMLEQGFKPVGKDFPVFIHPESGEEYALARTERKSGKGYTGFQYYASPDITLEQDLIRRDLTINAMAEDSEGNLIDPFGGQQDLQRRILRHVSPAFAEDPLRVLRVARFLARYAHLGFDIARETLALMQQLSTSDELEHLTSERVWQEFQRALSEQSPQCFLQVLSQCCALDKLFPELGETAKDSATLQQITETDNPEIRFALLMAKVSEHSPTDQRREQIILLCQQHRTPNSYRDLAIRLSLFGQTLIGFTQLSADQRLQLIKDLDLLRRPENLPDILQAAEIQAGHPLTARQLIPHLLEQLQQIQPGTLMQQGFKGKALGAAIQRQQLQICQQQINESTP